MIVLFELTHRQHCSTTAFESCSIGKTGQNGPYNYAQEAYYLACSLSKAAASFHYSLPLRGPSSSSRGRSRCQFLRSAWQVKTREGQSAELKLCLGHTISEPVVTPKKSRLSSSKSRGKKLWAKATPFMRVSKGMSKNTRKWGAQGHRAIHCYPTLLCKTGLRRPEGWLQWKLNCRQGHDSCCMMGSHKLKVENRN